MIAPRLANGDKRETLGHGLPPHIKDGLRNIARSENKSLSWVLEQIIIEYFGFKQPEYIARKNDKAGHEIKPQARADADRPGTKKAS